MLENRKYILWTVFAILLLFFGGDWLVKVLVTGPMARAEMRTKQLREKIQGKKTELKEIREEKEQLAVWETRSLPADQNLARSLYQAWLVELVEHVGLVNPNVDSSEPVNRNGLNVLTFTAKGQGTLEQATQLLFEFYRAGHLHQIRSLVLTPLQAGKQFDISLTIEALSLPYIERQGELSTVEGDAMISKKLGDYGIIAQRNVFGSGGDPDALAYTRLTAVTSTQGRPKAWFSVDLRSETVQKAVGEILEVGPFRATILEIDDSDVILEIDGQRRVLTIGETLGEASALPQQLKGL